MQAFCGPYAHERVDLLFTSGLFYEASQILGTILVLPRMREGSPKHLFRLYEGFHLLLVVGESDDWYVMSLD